MKFSDWIRHQKCLCYDSHGFECMGDVVGHHVKARGMGGNRDYEFDFFNLVPLCYRHHRLIHDSSLIEFEKKYQVNVFVDAENIYRTFAKWEEITKRFYTLARKAGKG